ncbi:hypothetical protein H8R17_08610 [Streptomyces sp. TRM68367]|nr:hypothetical protein [Streptomyces sp. TRM68367]
MAAATLVCGTAAAASMPPGTAAGHEAQITRAPSSADMGSMDGRAVATAMPDGAAACEQCAQDGRASCHAPVPDAVRATSPGPQPGATSGCGESYIPAPSAQALLTDHLTGVVSRPPDLHLLQRLRV